MTIEEKLKAEFTAKGADGKIYPAHKWRILTNKGLCAPYVDSRQVSGRLNEVFGVAGWSDSLTETNGEFIICELTAKIGNDIVTKTDVGTPTQKEREKGQASDALKRAAVKFGIGAYLYNMQPVTLQTTRVGNKVVPCTAKGEPLDTEEKLTAYMNMKSYEKQLLTEIFNKLTKENKEKLATNFKQIWEAL